MRFALKHYCAAVGMLVTGITTQAQMSMSDNSVLLSTNGTTTVSDTNRMFVIHDIIITGNNKTQPSTILRELPFDLEEGYPLSVIADKFKKARKQLMNTGLFRNVVVSLKSLDGYDVNVSVEVEEKWYIWPRVFVRTVDKSFGQWWNEKDRNMNRINYGIRLAHNNITGRNDKLKIALMNGYTRQFSLQYYGLWLDRQMKWSTNAGISFGKNKEVNYMTLFNKQVPIKNNDQFLRSYVSGFLQVNYRPRIKTTHTFGFGYTYEDVADTVFKLNPSFYYRSVAVRFPEISYRLSYFDVDFIPYPTKGLMGEVSLKKRGLTESMNLWELSAKVSKTWPLSSKYFFNLKGMGMIKLPFTQPYIGKQFIGYDGRFLQGYEYYVIDGVAGGFAKANISRLIFNTHISFPSQKLKRLNYIPIKLYAKTFVNAGYVYDNNPGENDLARRMLYSGGFGLDFITCNDFVIKIEWSFNRLGENGLYLHQRNDF
jgi:outer membrane protein assembly factor BamA